MECAREGSFSSYGTGYRAGNGPRSRSLGGILCRPSILEPFPSAGKIWGRPNARNPRRLPVPRSPRGRHRVPPPPSHRPRQSSASPLYVNPPVLRRLPANRFPGKRPAPALPKNTAKNAALPVPATTTSISKNARTTRSVTLETPSWRDRAAFWTLPCA